MPIHFCGDVTIDNFEFYGEFPPQQKHCSGVANQSWGPNRPTKIIVRQFGGAELLARFTAAAWSLYNTALQHDTKMSTIQPWADFNDIMVRKLKLIFNRPRKFDHCWQLSYRLRKCKDAVYRVEQGGHEGFTRPQTKSKIPISNIDIELSVGSQKMFVVNDAGRDARNSICLADKINSSENALVIMKILDPPAADVDQHQLLSRLLEKNPNRVVGIVPADELRKSGAPISRALSWERSLGDVIDQVKIGRLIPRFTPPHLIITFDYDAALYLKTDKESHGRVVKEGSLIFSIDKSEGEFANADDLEGEMPGAQSLFVSVLSTLLFRQIEDGVIGDNLFDDINKYMAYALIAKRRFLQAGFPLIDGKVPFETKTNEMPRLHYSEGIFSLIKMQDQPSNSSTVLDRTPDPFIRDERKIKERYFCNPLELNDELKTNLKEHKLAIYRLPPNQIITKGWSIFDKVSSSEGLSVFTKYVIEGHDLEGVPICSFGKIKTASVREIEDFRTIKKLLQSYLSNHTSSGKPLGIAVFGPPGAGKGFAVKNIMETLPESLKKLVKKDDRHECNLTAFSDPEDLAHYFQLARNSAVRGNVPVLFFDEFDCTVGNAKFFWLKHFLAPLQDGQFVSRHIVHPIGRAIFVFAGGVRHTFEDFANAMLENSNSDGETPNFKGVDFLSRLHGHIDISALSPDDSEKEAFLSPGNGKPTIVIDPSYLMRRAFILRSLLDGNVKRIFSKSDPPRAQINERIVNSLLATTKFYHGARSMEAIIRMSSLNGSDSFEINHLPPDNQLRMHVDSDNFSACLAHDVKALWNMASK